MDLGFRGPKYTWTNCQEGQNLIKERLDRCLANLEWRDIFPEAEIVVEVMTSSDHAVLVLQLLGQHKQQLKRRNFRFEARWIHEPGYQEVFLEAWNNLSEEGDTWLQLGEKLSRCQASISRWRGRVHGSTSAAIKALQQKLNEEQGCETLWAAGELKKIQQDLES
ncbi:uncharacterized protein LOC132185138 [Corylus avellana]|uniref:uncharacterized protein LOC132185138 n=1 Tax=Corylus avellana TaxID=13451 RepID=UPI00286D40B0|nr:uncharacterized protein LOC132185138 [Corylus avellana]